MNHLLWKTMWTQLLVLGGLFFFCASTFAEPPLPPTENAGILNLQSKAVEKTKMENPSRCNSSPNVSSPDIFDCYWQKTYIENRIKSQLPTPDLFKEIYSHKPQIIFLGEVHIDFAVQQREPGLLEELSQMDSALNCLFIEASSSFQSHIDDYMNGISSFETAIAPFQDFQKDYTPLAAASKNLLDAARTRNIHVFAVDTKSENFDSRSKTIAENIATLFESKKCSHAVMIVGKDHLVQQTVDSHPKKDTPIPQRLKSKKISTVTVNLEQSPDRWLPAKCDGSISLNKKEMGFLNTAPSPAMVAPLYDYLRAVKWNDFDYALHP